MISRLFVARLRDDAPLHGCWWWAVTKQKLAYHLVLPRALQ